MIGEGGVKVSGGERQRLSIARALLRRPHLLVFDEATSSLDSITEEEISQTIRDVDRAEDAITILIAHRLSTIMHADRIYVLERGRIVEEGRHDELLAAARPVLRDVAPAGGRAPTSRLREGSGHRRRDGGTGAARDDVTDVRAHILQHVPFESPGSILPALQARGADGRLDAAVQPETRCRAADDFDLLVVMGGPMSVNDEAEYPWLVDEKRW